MAMGMGEYTIKRVPLVKHIYSAAKQASEPARLPGAGRCAVLRSWCIFACGARSDVGVQPVSHAWLQATAVVAPAKRLLAVFPDCSPSAGCRPAGLGGHVARQWAAPGFPVPLVHHHCGQPPASTLAQPLQVSAAVSPDNGAANSFRECVIIRHPRRDGEYAFAFITGQTVLQARGLGLAGWVRRAGPGLRDRRAGSAGCRARLRLS